MKNKIIVLISVLCLFGFSNVKALTNEDMLYLEGDFDSLSNNLFEGLVNEEYVLFGCSGLFFDENEMPNIKAVHELVYLNLMWSKEGEEYKYIINDDFSSTSENVFVKITAEDFENEIKATFNVDDKYIFDNRDKFNPEFSKNSGYKEIDGKYYYYAEQMLNLGSSGCIKPLIMGYKDLGNNNYQVYYYGVGPDNGDEDFDNEDNIIVERDNKYLVTSYYTTKVEYKDGKIKYLSFEAVDGKSLQSDKDIVLYEETIESEKLNFIDLKNSFDAKNDKTLMFSVDYDFEMFDKVFINDKEVNKEMYEAKSGSTIITFKDEFVKTLKNGDYDLKISFKDGNVAETKFTIKNSTVDEAAKNPDTGIYTGIIAILVMGILGSFIYKFNKNRNVFPNA